jgi:hypothetical protein
MEPESGAFDSLLVHAICAPSGDNTQPWRFIVDPTCGRIALRVDETRDRSPMNAGQRMARIAVGAALENLLQSARALGWTAALEPAGPPDLAVVRLSEDGTESANLDVITSRVTNRRPYDARPVPEEILREFSQEVPELDGVSTHWIVDRDRIRGLAEVIGSADALMFGEPSMRQAFLSKVRFDAMANEPVDEGLCLGSLEVAGFDRMALRMMRRAPNWVIKLGGAGRIFAAKARQLVESSSGLCLIAAPDGSEETDLSVGRAMQRAWLALTSRGFAAQPMMSLPVLENVLDHGDPAIVASVGRDRVTSLGACFRAMVTELGDRRPAFLLRFGFAPAPTGRTGRLPTSAVTARVAPIDLSRQGHPS